MRVPLRSTPSTTTTRSESAAITRFRAGNRNGSAGTPGGYSLTSVPADDDPPQELAVRGRVGDVDPASQARRRSEPPASRAPACAQRRCRARRRRSRPDAREPRDRGRGIRRDVDARGRRPTRAHDGDAHGLRETADGHGRRRRPGDRRAGAGRASTPGRRGARSVPRRRRARPDRPRPTAARGKCGRCRTRRHRRDRPQRRGRAPLTPHHGVQRSRGDPQQASKEQDGVVLSTNPAEPRRGPARARLDPRRAPQLARFAVPTWSKASR